MADRRIYVETQLRGDLDTLWQRTQDPTEHARWDLRFSEIVKLPTPDGEAQRFRYSVHVPGVTRLRVSGTGVSVGERHAADGSRTSALKFTTGNRWSPIRAGSGYWRYIPVPGGVRFLTGYQYRPGPQGRVLDDLLVRPLIGAMTAWSFDRLRLWVDTGLPPDVAARRSVLVLAARALGCVASAMLASRLRTPWQRGAAALLTAVALLAPVPLQRPAAGRALRRAPDRVGTQPPATLAGLRLPGASAA